jgi:hypothetical protein
MPEQRTHQERARVEQPKHDDLMCISAARGQRSIYVRVLFGVVHSFKMHEPSATKSLLRYSPTIAEIVRVGRVIRGLLCIRIPIVRVVLILDP